MLISKQCYGKFCIANVRLCQYFEYNDNFCYYTNTVLLSPHCVQVVGVAAATGWDQLMGDY